MSLWTSEISTSIIMCERKNHITALNTAMISLVRNMRRLERMLSLQKEFQDTHDFNPALHMIASAILAEAGELWAVSGGKWWSKKQHKDEDRKEELIDILHFFLAYCVKMEISAKELFELYVKKLSENYERQLKGY